MRWLALTRTAAGSEGAGFKYNTVECRSLLLVLLVSIAGCTVAVQALSVLAIAPSKETMIFVMTVR